MPIWVRPDGTYINWYEPGAQYLANQPGEVSNQPAAQSLDPMALASDPLLGMLMQYLGGGQQPESTYQAESGNMYVAGQQPVRQVPTTQQTPLEASISAGQESKWNMLPPDQMLANYLQNQGVAAGLTDREAFALSQELGIRQKIAEQKSDYTDTIAAIAGGKRVSEEEDRAVKIQQLEAKIAQQEQDRRLKEALAKVDLEFKKFKLSEEQKEFITGQIATFARTKITDPETLAEKFPDDKQIDEYTKRVFGLMKQQNTRLDSAVKQLLDSLPKNKGTDMFRKLVEERGAQEALNEVNKSPSVPPEFKQFVNQLFAPYVGQ